MNFWGCYKRKDALLPSKANGCSFEQFTARTPDIASYSQSVTLPRLFNPAKSPGVSLSSQSLEVHA